MFKYYSSIIFVAAFIVFLSSSALALDPLVPCGGKDQPLCTTCDFLVLGKNVSDFILVYLVPALAALFFIYAGFEILLGGGIPARVAKGRAIFQTTAYGILIIFTAWLIVNTVLRTVARDENIAEHWWELECRENITTTTPANPPDNNTGNSTQNNDLPGNMPNSNTASESLSPNIGSNTLSSSSFSPVNPQMEATPLSILTPNLPNGRVAESYSQNISVIGGAPPYSWSKTAGNFPAGLSMNSSGTISGRPTVSGTATFTLKAEDSSTPKKTDSKQFTIQIATTSTGNNTQFQTTNCGDFNLVCSDTARSCPAYGTDRNAPAGRTNWSYLIPAVAGEHPVPGVNTVKLLDSIMRIESSGILDRVSQSSPPSCGLMQFQASTANIYKDRCGVNHTITCDWLRGRDLRAGETLETVARASICLSAEYFKAIKSSSCYARARGEPKDLAAGYNGGDGCDQNNSRGNALALSVSCSDRTTADPKYNLSCGASRPTLRYECLWNNLPHTTCNTGFVETRDYVAKFNSCYN